MSLCPAPPTEPGTDIIDEDTTMISRRNLIGGSAILAGAAAVSGRVQAAASPEAITTTSPTMQPPLVPSSGPAYQ
ncbi:MAG TPA: twin-arginine translocation signal domain-containing protein, partial [Pseudolabrys sp.]|nr:twin-arginine translocation signal domain-containing protein [Pseudolabrys sp.]